MAKGDRPSTTGARAIQMAGANRCVYIKAKKQLRYSYRLNGGNLFPSLQNACGNKCCFGRFDIVEWD